MINRNNYEMYVIDYLDGTLSPEATAELVLFLEQNPDIAAEVELLRDQPSFAPGEEGFPDKEMLRKPLVDIPDEETELLMARSVDGDLSAEEQRELESRLRRNPGLARHMAAMEKATLGPEPTTFEHKSSLYFPSGVDLSSDETLLIALLEGDLAPDSQKSLRARMEKEPALAGDFRLLQATRITPERVVFEDKGSLYRRNSRVIPLRRALYFTTASAAAVLLFFTIFWQGEQHPAEGFATWVPRQWEWKPAQADTLATPGAQETIQPDNQSQPKRQRLPEPVDQAPDLTAETQKDKNRGNVPSIDKLKLIGDAALASHMRNGGLKVVTSKVNSPEPIVIPDDMAQAPAVPQHYPTIIEYLGDKAKHKIFGNEVPEEDVALAIVEKGIKKAVKDDVILSRKSCGNDKGFHFKLGKLEICRSRRS